MRWIVTHFEATHPSRLCELRTATHVLPFGPPLQQVYELPVLSWQAECWHLRSLFFAMVPTEAEAVLRSALRVAKSGHG